MWSPAPAPALASPVPRHIRWGFAAAALLDAGASLLLYRSGRVGLRLAAVAYAGLHVLALGLVLSAGVAGAMRVLPRRRGAAPLAALLVAFAAGWGVFVDDFSVFPWWLRAGLTLGAALPFAVLAALWARAARSRLAGAAYAIAASIGVAANHLGLDGSYPGIHLMTHLLVGLAASLAVAGLRVPALPLPPRTRGAVAPVVLGLACLSAAFSLVVWPSNAVLVTLARLPTASAVPFLARLHEDDGRGGAAGLAPEQRPWFEPRAGRPAVPPTSPPLFRGPPLVIFLTIDALRADVLLGPGEKEALATPSLRALAERGASFTMARSTAASTSPAISTIFLGRYYSSLHWTEQDHDRKVKFFLSEESSPRFPELLREHGVESAFVPTATAFLPEYGTTRGMTPLGEKVVAGADKAIPKIRKWLEGVGEGPAMVWAHLLDPHFPYVRGDPDAPAYDRYLAEVAYVDQQIEKLVSLVAARKLQDRVFFLISADHGESFGEHGTTQHASTVYEEMVRVPLLVVGPGIQPRTIAEPVSVIDIGATLLDLFGVETPGTWMGESLVPLLAGKDVELSRPIVLDAGRRKQGIVSRDGVKAIRNLRQKTEEAYDLVADPGELQNLLEASPALANERLGAVRAFFDVHERRAPGYAVPFRE